MEYGEFREAYLAKMREIDEFIRYGQVFETAAAFPDIVKFGCDFLFKGDKSEIKKCIDAIYDVFGEDRSEVFNYMFDLDSLHQRREGVISLSRSNEERYAHMLEELTNIIDEANESGLSVEHETQEVCAYVTNFLGDVARKSFLRSLLGSVEDAKQSVQ